MRADVILAFHNRRALTASAVERLLESADRAGVEVGLFAFDDGSSDGTADALRGIIPTAVIIQGDGTSYWACGMAQAESEALRAGEGDFIVWLNDDVRLDRDAFERISALMDDYPNSILVGATRDPETLELTYSGMRRAGRHPLSFAITSPREAVTRIDAFNGNFVIVPRTVAQRMGGIDGAYSHALADIDYGLRANALNIPVLLAPGTFGACPRNPPPPPRTAATEWREFLGPKGGGNWSSLSRFMRRHSPAWWILPISATYVLWWSRRLARRLAPK